MPAPFAGFDVYSDQAAREKIRTGAIATIIIAGGIFDWQIDKAEFGIARNWRPDAGVAGEFDPFVKPRLVTHLPSLRDGMKGPK